MGKCSVAVGHNQRENRNIALMRKKEYCSDLWKTEDYWAIWLALLLIAAAVFLYRPAMLKEIVEEVSWSNTVLQTERAKAPFRTVKWYEADEAKSAIRSSDSDIAKFLKNWTAKPHKWQDSIWDALYQSDLQASLKNQEALSKYEESGRKAVIAMAYALTAEQAAQAAGFSDTALNRTAQEKIKEWRQAHLLKKAAEKKIRNTSYNIFPTLFFLMIFMGLFFSVAVRATGQNPGKFLVGFAVLFFLAVLSYLLAAQATMQHYGVSYAVWAIIIGLLIANTVGTPAWVRPALRVELYIKTGLVLLGAEILLNKIIAIGLPGIFVAWGCTPIVLITTFWFGQRVLKMESKTLNMVVSADMSVCGTSAAIATAAACRAKKEELTFAIGLSLVFTSVMMVVMPMFIKAVNMHDVLAGAWLGGTIDATGAVAAAGSLVSERAMHVAATIKMIQNILIGIVAFCVAVYWVAKVEKKTDRNVSALEIWWRFPKFVIGFVAVSIIFSSLYALLGDDVGYVVVEHGIIRSGTKLFRNWFFCLSFVAIGLECNFRELKNCFKGGKTLLLYLFGQSLQLVLSLLMAYLAFFILFPDITATI